MLKEVVGYDGNITFDSNMPDGIMEKRLNSSKLETYTKIDYTDLKNGNRMIYHSGKKLLTYSSNFNLVESNRLFFIKFFSNLN